MTRAVALLAGIAALAAHAGCEAPPLKIAFDVSGGPAQACPSTKCSEVPMLCDAILNVRILRPSEPLAPFVSLCEPVPPNRHRDLCSIASVDLPSRELPNETLEVQVMIWPRDAVAYDAAADVFDCHEIYGKPTSIAFDLHGFPEEIAPAPALGGHAFFRPGDSQTVVTLGCSDLQAVNRPACFGTSSIEVAATVNDFRTPNTTVFPSTAKTLRVSVGEPRYDPDEGVYVFRTAEKQELHRTDDPTGLLPAWGAFLDNFELHTAACIEVYEDTGPTIATVRCRPVTPGELRLDFVGIWLDSARLETIRRMALGLPVFPQEGLTIGLVLDDNGNPAANVQVIPEVGGNAVKYLSVDGTAVIPNGTATTAGGLFVSETVPYGTRFNASGPGAQTASGIGGLIRGKVTIVVLQLSQVAE